MNYRSFVHVFFWFTFLCSSAIAQENKVIKVSGTGTVSLKPDRAKIHMRVSNVNKSIVSGKKTVDENVIGVQNMLLDFGVKPTDINTSVLSVYEERNDQINRDRSKQEGYRVTRDIILQIDDISKLDIILDNALNLGTNSIQDIEFYSSTVDELKLAAMKKASDDARKKAEFLTSKFGCKLGQIQQIEYDYKGQEQQLHSVAAGLRSGAPSFLQGTIKITATVNIVYQIQ